MNWFDDLKKYLDTDKLSQEENFLSTAFAGILEADPELRDKVVGYLFDGRTLQHPLVETQRGIGGKIPDIMIYDGEEPTFVGAIECKLNADPDEDQLLQYEQLLKAEYSCESVVIFLGRHPKPHFEKFPNDKVFTWAELSKFLVDSPESARDFLRKELLKLMDLHGLTPIPALPVQWMQDLQVHIEGANTIEQLLLAISDRLVRLGLTKNLQKVERGNKTQLAYRGIQMTTLKDANVGIYLVWGRKQPFGSVLHVSGPPPVLETLRGQVVKLHDGRETRFQERICGWGGIGCFVPVENQADQTFWRGSSDDQNSFLFNRFHFLLSAVKLV